MATLSGSRRWRVAQWLATLAVVLATTAAAITVGLRVTPMQDVSVAGQVIAVGATAPDWRMSGPGEVDLFGQSLPTRLRFSGPVRPRLTLARITINSELTNFMRGATPAGTRRRLGQALADGWTRYFGWETALTALTALVLLGAVAGWRRLPRRTTIKLLASGLAVTEAVNLGAIMIAAYQAPRELAQVRSLGQLVGDAPPAPASVPGAARPPRVQAVVVGDSTAAGAGLPPVQHASGLDLLCGRSEDSYAADLATVNDWRVINLACDSATIRQGLLGPERRHGRKVRAQVTAARRLGGASVVIVSVGADDLNWAGTVIYCALAPRCNDGAAAAYFQQQLAAFNKSYLQLLTRLAALPGRPRVVVNQYYDPFGPKDCLGAVGLTPAKIATLSSRLATLNTVLARGAAEFGDASAQPDFAGHQLCSSQPYVQGLNAAAPLHPTAEGELAIALADQAVLRSGGQASTAQPAASAQPGGPPGSAGGPGRDASPSSLGG